MQHPGRASATWLPFEVYPTIDSANVQANVCGYAGSSALVGGASDDHTYGLRRPRHCVRPNGAFAQGGRDEAHADLRTAAGNEVEDAGREAGFGAEVDSLRSRRNQLGAHPRREGSKFPFRSDKKVEAFLPHRVKAR